MNNGKFSQLFLKTVTSVLILIQAG